MALALLWLAGCAQPAEDYLAEANGAPFEADAGPGADASPAATPVGPTVLGARSIPLTDVAEPRGLAVHGDHLWTTDRADDRLVEFDLDGRQVSATPLPARGARALAWHDDALFVGYADRLYRLDGDAAVLVAEGLRDLQGLTTGERGLVSAEGDHLNVRAAPRFATVLEIDLDGAPGPLTRFGADYLLYDRSPRTDGVTFSARFTVADASSPSRATPRGTVDLPADLGRVTSVAAEGGTLYLVGAGYGGDLGRVVALDLAPEPGR